MGSCAQFTVGLDERALMATLDADLRVHAATAALCGALGREPADVVGRRLDALLEQDLSPALTAQRDGRLWRCEAKVQGRDAASDRWLECTLLPPSREAGSTAAVFVDITGRRAVEEDLRRAERRFAMALSSAPVTVFEQDRDLRYRWVYNAVAPATVESVLGKNERELLGEANAAVLEPIKLRVMATGVPDRQQVRLEMAGGVRWWDLYVEPKRNGSGAVVGVTCSGVDVTRDREQQARLQVMAEERRVALEAAQEAESRLRQAVEAADIGMWEWHVDTGVTRYNDRWFKMLGYPADEPVRTYAWFSELLHPDERDIVVAQEMSRVQGVRDETWAIEHRMLGSDGRWRWILNRGRVVERDAHGRGVRATGTHIDITRRRLREQALRDSERRFRSLVTASAQIVWRTGPDGTPRERTPGWEDFTGQAFEEYRERGWLDAIHPDDREATAAAWRRAVEERTLYETEHRLRRRDGEWRNCLVRGVPVLDDEGQVLEWVGTHTDVTDQRRAEAQRARLEAEMRQVQRLESIGTLASGLAHDVNNLLTAILGYAEAARRSLPAGHHSQHALQMIDAAAEQAASVAGGMLAFARESATSREVVDLGAVAREAFELLDRLLPANIRTRPSWGDAPAFVDADATQMKQVVMNLAVNARDAMPAGGELTLEVQADGEEVVLVVRDTGHGMSEEVKARAFDPFFTTKTRGRGTGMGLAVVHGIVAAHGGRVSVQSQPGRGATFEVRLPRVPGPPARPAAPQAARPAATSRHVLVAEDNALVRDVMTQELEHAGYRVTATGSCDGLLAAAGGAAADAALVVLDLDLPGFRRDWRAAIRRALPSRPILVATASPRPPKPDHRTLFVLRKPFRMIDLVRRVDQILAPDARQEDTPCPLSTPV